MGCGERARRGCVEQRHQLGDALRLSGQKDCERGAVLIGNQVVFWEFGQQDLVQSPESHLQ